MRYRIVEKLYDNPTPYDFKHKHFRRMIQFQNWRKRLARNKTMFSFVFYMAQSRGLVFSDDINVSTVKFLANLENNTFPIDPGDKKPNQNPFNRRIKDFVDEYKFFITVIVTCIEYMKDKTVELPKQLQETNG